MTPTPLTRSLAATLLLGAGVAQADLANLPSGNYDNDPTHSYITFSYTHLGLSNPMLSFDDFELDLDFEQGDPTGSRITANIDPTSIVAGSEIWKEHLSGADFFDFANHPEITFVSTSIEGAGDGAYKVVGDLTIKEVTKPLTLDVTINAAMNHPMSGDPVIGLTGSGQLLRSDYGMDKFVPNVSDEVTLAFTAEMVMAK